MILIEAIRVQMPKIDETQQSKINKLHYLVCQCQSLMGTASLVRSSLSNSSDQQAKGKEKPLLIQTHNAMPMSMRIKRSLKIKSPTAATTRNGMIDRFQISAQFKTSQNVFRSLDRSSAE